MENINSLRKRVRVDCEPGKGYVLYWMQIHRRLHYNYALEYAVAWANKLKRPLVILEGVAADYPWATARTTTFLLQGMAEHLQRLHDSESVTYIPWPEKEKGSYDRLLRDLCSGAAILISDEYPVFIMRERNRRLQKELDIPFVTVDSNGILPMALSRKAPYSAFVFRRLMQEKFLECWRHPPVKSPLQKLHHFGKADLPDDLHDRREAGAMHLETDEAISAFIRQVPDLNRQVAPVDLKGTRKAALARLNDFVSNDLESYDDDRNHPDKERTSRLSPWLHTGKISPFEVVEKVFSKQPDGWDVNRVRPAGGKRSGFFGGHPAVESYLDEVITWRETGFHFADQTPGYDRYDSLPDWALQTLSDHAKDPREHSYSYDDLAKSATHDPLWNAAQTQLREEGRIHNYLRMLWGKKVLEWTPDPQTALKYLIDLNNTYALDGRDPNSYSGIFWIVGRFDRAWGPERPVFGKIRYMSSDSARKKIRLDEYLRRYATKAK
ncbi:hypothetical protein QA596_07725 [Balneolales bacterium ANBcel1]|nr:hypothetical protein [Balneolales bacterium ANBcel1]